jgi:protein disulfide-isomerase A1
LYQQFEREDEVIVLTDSNFDAVIAENDIILVEFYAPWCGHCKSLAPEYASAAKTLAALNPPINIAKLDATAHEKAAKKFDIKGFPTLKLFKSGSDSSYEGGRTAADIVSFMKKKSGPVVKIITDVDAFKTEAKVVVVGHFASESSAEFKAFSAAADALDDAPFGAVIGGSSNSVTVYKDFDEGVAEYSGAFEKAEILAFVGGNRLPTVIPFNQENARLLFGEEQPIRVQALLMAKADDKAILDDFAVHAKAYKGKILAVHVDETQERVLSYFGVKASDLPSVVVVHMPTDGGMKKYIPSNAKDIKNLNKFIDSYFAGKEKPTLKSEEIPEQTEAVYTLVGKAFESVALDDSKDVLVEFYAPWCGHCKALAPKYEKLAEALKGVKSVVVAKMDSTANEVDHPDVNISGFPTLKFFPANSGGKVVDYDGARETDAMLQFIHKNAGIKFDLDSITVGEEDDEEEEL